MKLKYLFLFLILTTPIYSQISIGVSGGTNLFSTNLSMDQDVLNTYWHNGINFSIDGEYFISRKISINSIIEYGYYKFDNYIETGAHIPEISLVSATGKDSKAIRIFTNIRFYINSSKIFQGFIETGIGYVSENIGTITAIYDDMNSGQFKSELNYQGKHNFVHSFGIGCRIKLNQYLAIDVSASYYSVYTNFLNAKTGIGFIYLFNNN